MENENQLYKVIGKSKRHLVAYPDPEGSYTKAELTAWYQKGHEVGETRQVEFADSKTDAENLAGENIDEDTYTQTYGDTEPGGENPQPEDEQFREDRNDLTPEDRLYRKELGVGSFNDAEAVNNAIEYDHDAEVHTFDNKGMPPEYSIGEMVDDTAVDLKNDVEEMILKIYPKYFSDIRIDDYRPFKYDPTIPEFAEPVILKYGYTGWEKLPDDLYSFLLSKFSVKERYGYEDHVQYIIYPKEGERFN